MADISRQDIALPVAKKGMAKTNRRAVIVAVLGALVIIGLLIAVIVLASKHEKDSNPEQPQAPSLPQSLVQQYGVDDGLGIKWFPNVTDEGDITEALKENVQMIEINVEKNGGKFYIRGGLLDLNKALDRLKANNVGVKINTDRSVNTVADAKELIEEIKGHGFNTPVIITLPVFSETFNWTLFLSDDVDKDGVIISFDLEADDTELGRGTVEYVDFLYNQSESNSLIEVDAENVFSSWDNLRWLLSKNKDLVLLLSQNVLTNNDTLYDVLTVRNDIEKNKIVYNFGETLLTEFRHLASTAGSPLHYFDIVPRDAGKIIWSHNTDTWEQLNEATSGDVMMIEGDIRLSGQGQALIPIMAHDVGENNNLTFEQWLDEIIEVNKGMKLDFKSLDAVRPALEIVNRKRDNITGPIWLNADILKGPNARETRIPASEFLDAVDAFPEATLSLGWTTISKGSDFGLKYTMTMVQEMNSVCKMLKQPVTFPVRAEQLVDSWVEFDWLLKQSRGYTLTVWTAKDDNVTRNDMDYIKRRAEASRVYFDLPEELRPSF